MKKLTLLATAACLTIAPLAASAGNLAGVAADSMVIAPAPQAQAALGGVGLAGVGVALGAVALVALIAANSDDDSSGTTTTPQAGE